MSKQRDISNDNRPIAGMPQGFDALDELPDDDQEITESTPVEEQEDGSAIVQLEDEDAEAEESEFLSNLAEEFEETTLTRLATDLQEAIERDKESRSKRDEQYAEGIKRTGLGNEAPGGAEFNGASKAVHPALVEGCIDFAARASKELLPASGPCKTSIIGEVTKAKQEKADRKKQYMNWQFTQQIKEYRAELESMLSQVPLGGSQYLKVWYDERFERPRCEFIPVDEMYLPFAANDFYSAQRQTHRQMITRQEYDRRVESGLYRDLKLQDSGTPIMGESAAQVATDKIQGREDLSYNEDGLREIFEVYLDENFKEDTVSDGKVSPYIATLDASSTKILGLYRNWQEGDKKREKLDWITEFGMIPWRGAYKIGLAHLIGGLSSAMTGSLRALLDSALINTIPAGLRLKGARIAGQSLQINPTELTEIEGPTSVDDIRKVAMPFPFNPPSAVLYQLLEWLGIQAKGVVGVADEKIADVGANAPVGTALAVIEQGSITYSTVHTRLHESQRRVLAIVHRINGMYLDDEVTVEELGELVVRREDFLGPMDVIPVSDPNIFSDTQRYAQQQAVMGLKQLFPGMFKDEELLKRNLQLLKYPDYEAVLNVPGDPKELDAISENLEAHKPQSTLKDYPEQDHLSHIKTHLTHLSSPVFCANPMMAMPAMPKLVEHCKQHLLAYYAQHMLAATQATQAITKTALDDAQAQASVIADQEMAKELAPIVQQLFAAQQMMQQFMPKPPADPHVQAAQMKIEADAKEADAQRAFDQTAATQEQSAANARHDEEMQVARDNAALADKTAAETRELQATLAEMKEQHATERAQAALDAANAREAAKADLQQALAAQTAATNLQLEQLRGVNAQNLEILTQILTTTQAASAAKADGEAADTAKKETNASSIEAAVTKMSDVVTQLLTAKNKPTRFKAVRDAAGNLSHIESSTTDNE